MPTKPGRAADRKQTNRRQKHELAYRAKKWRCSKLAVILADMLEALTEMSPLHANTAEGFIERAKSELRRSNREARK